MKTIKTSSGALAMLAALPLTVYAHDQPLATIREKLEHEYQPTKTSDDKSDIVKAGSVVVLHKDKVLMVAATATGNPCMNTYREDKIKQNIACRVAATKAAYLNPRPRQTARHPKLRSWREILGNQD